MESKSVRIHEHAFKDLLFHVADLQARLYELEFELEEIRKVLLDFIERGL